MHRLGGCSPAGCIGDGDGDILQEMQKAPKKSRTASLEQQLFRHEAQTSGEKRQKGAGSSVVPVERLKFHLPASQSLFKQK